MDSVHSQSHWHFGMYLSHRKKAIQSSHVADEAGCSTVTRGVTKDEVLVHVTDGTEREKSAATLQEQ